MRDGYAQRMMEMGEYVCSRLGEKTAERQTGPVSFLPCWKAWRQAGEQMVQEEEPEPVEYLIRLYGLGEFEQFCLAMLVWAEADPGGVRGALQEAGLDGMSPGTLMSLWEGRLCFHRERYASFLSGGPLAGWVVQEPAGPWEPLRLDGRIHRLVLGGRWLDPEMEEMGQWFWPDQYREGEMKAGFGENEYRRICGFMGSGRGCLLMGPEGIGKRTQLRRFARDHQRPVFCGEARAFLLENPERRRERLKQAVRECRIQQAALCLCRCGDSEEEQELLRQAHGLAARYLPGFAVIQAGEEPVPEELTELVQIAIAPPNLRQQADLWKEMAGEYRCGPDVKPEELAGIMTMTPGQIRRTLERGDLLRRQEGLDRIEERHLRESAGGMADGRLQGKAIRVEPRYGFEDLILPEKQKSQLRAVCSQVKNRYRVYEEWGFSSRRAYGTGLSIVFSGPPGTGKTMAAQVMARELGLELYKVDLAAVVSKYVGETEKNLNLIFEEGKKSRAILFFDEADVLFSKRTEVKDSHDKYNNMEAAFLLQKMEEYTGAAVLATNYLQNIDEAFKRRFTYIVEFPFPDADSRRLLWESAAPQQLPLDRDVDFDFLAETFDISGSQIKNSLLGAAFLAADEGQKQVRMGHVLKALEQELYKSGRKISREALEAYGLAHGNGKSEGSA